jgi:CheY-like chemotaxis protein
MNGELKEYELANGSAANPRNPGILIADDMGLILTLLKLELEPRGFNVWLAVDGDDALDLYRRHRRQIDLVLLEVQMPGLDGPQTLDALQQFNPDVVACFMNGNPSIYTEEDLLELGAVCVFNKPWRPAEVAHCLQSLVSAPGFTPFVCDWQIRSERDREPRTLRDKLASSPLLPPVGLRTKTHRRTETMGRPCGWASHEMDVD